MNWLTAEEVKRESTTPEKALDMSEKHWEQLATATNKEAKGADYRFPFLLGSSLCGLCTYWKRGIGKCGECPLGNCYRMSQYGAAEKLYRVWTEEGYGQPDFKAFKSEARKMLKLLKSLKENKMDKKQEVKGIIINLQSDLADAQAKLKKLDEKFYSIGDRFLNSCHARSPYKLILASSNDGRVVLIELGDGSRYGGETTVSNKTAITEAEIGAVLHGNQSFITRYYDARKKVKI